MTTKNKVRNAFDRKRLQTIVNSEGGAQQQFKDECDVNMIVDMYVKTRDPRYLNPNEANYGVMPSQTFHEAMNIVVQGQQMFEELPSEVRKKFDNNPSQFLQYMDGNPDTNELYELGLIKNRPTEEVLTSSGKEGSTSESASASTTENNPEGVSS